MSSTAFSAVNRALRTKRTFSKELTAALNDAKSETGLSLGTFEEKEDYFEHNWEAIVTSTEECIHLIDDGEEQGDEQIEEQNYQVELLKEKKEQFLNLDGKYKNN